jgi:hypothetical protein
VPRGFFFYSGLINKFVFDTLQIPGGCSHICRRCSSPTCTSLVAALRLVKWFRRLPNPWMCVLSMLRGSCSSPFGALVVHPQTRYQLCEVSRIRGSALTTDKS